jgi:hypothetical protein
MTEIRVTHTRVEITKTTYRKGCPYCRKRPLKKKTCGHFTCQYKHHILTMRKKRKTDQKRPTAQIKIAL